MSQGSHEDCLRKLEAVFRRGAESASGSLSRWLGRPVRLAVSRARSVELAEAGAALGPGEAIVSTCVLELSGAVPGTILLVFEDRSGLEVVDLLLGQPPGTSAEWGDLQRSAAQETANIIACAFVGSLAEGLGQRAEGGPWPCVEESLVPGPPQFRREFAASLLQFAVMDQAAQSDRVVLVEARFAVDGAEHPWSLLLVPGASGLPALGIEPRETGDDVPPAGSGGLP